MVKNLPAMQDAWVRSFGWEDPLEIEHGIPLQYSGLENPRGQGSLVGYSPWGRKESDTHAIFAVKESESESPSIMSDSSRAHGLYSPWNYSRPEYWSV